MMRYKLLIVFLFIPSLTFIFYGCDDDDWDNPFGVRTKLAIANNSSSDVVVEIDQHQNGQIRYLGVVPAFSIRKWEVDAGWAWLFIDGEAFEIYLDSSYDGWFEISER